MAASNVSRNLAIREEFEEDKDLQNELKLLVEKVTGPDPKLIPPALEMLKYLIRTSTTSMTSVPKPLKYLAPYYNILKSTHQNMPKGNPKFVLADVISVLAMGTAGGEEARKQRECLKYCVMGTMKNIGDWGHEYIRQLESEIVQQWGLPHCEIGDKILMPLINDIIDFDCNHHAEIQACDLLMEIDQLQHLPQCIAPNNYGRMCYYLVSCAKYVDDKEREKIMKLIYAQYLKFGEYSRALIVGLQLNNKEMVNDVFLGCKDKLVLYQLAFICARHLFPVQPDSGVAEFEGLDVILCNNLLNNYFIDLARELDVMTPKLPEDVFKIWLEPVPTRLQILGGNLDSARQNLASSIVNGLVNAGFGCDKLLSSENGLEWIYKNKDHGMLSAVASLGLIYLWDVDGGLTPIDKFLYTSNDYITSGALLALGMVNCRVRNECDPALALLGDYVKNNDEVLQVGSILGLGLAYAGSQRNDILSLLLPLLNPSTSAEILGITSVACGLVSLGNPETEVPGAILNVLVELNIEKPDSFKSFHMTLTALGVALCYYGARGNIEVPTNAVEVLVEPFKTVVQMLLLMCSYAGTGDVLIVQKLLAIVGDKFEAPVKPTEPEAKPTKKQAKKEKDWDWTLGQAVATLAVAVVSFGEEIGMEMIQRVFGNIGRYGEPSVKRAVPLAIALLSVSNPQLQIMDVLTKYSHDADVEVACNAIFGLGLLGSGTNNARLASVLRQLAVFHAKNPSQLFMVRIAQGLLFLGKGTMTLNPLHTDRMLLDPVGMAGLLVTTVSLLEPHSLILHKSHYLLYTLSVSIQPRWVLTLDENLEIVPTTVRVGQAVDVVGKAGTPKTISGIHTHTTPVLLAVAERAELATDQFEIIAPTLDGICVLKKNPNAQQ